MYHEPPIVARLAGRGLGLDARPSCDRPTATRGRPEPPTGWETPIAPALRPHTGAACAGIIGMRDGKLPATNGWEFWQFKGADGALRSLDALRQEYLGKQPGAAAKSGSRDRRRARTGPNARRSQLGGRRFPPSRALLPTNAVAITCGAKRRQVHRPVGRLPGSVS